MKLHFFLLLAILVVWGCSSPNNPTGPVGNSTPIVETQRTFVLSSPTDSRLPLAMDEDVQATEGERMLCKDAQRDMDDSQGDPPPPDAPPLLWNRVTTRLGFAAKFPPPLLSREYALVHGAMYDALLAAHKTNRHDLLDNAVCAGAATTVLKYLFPRDSAIIFDRIRNQLHAAHGRAI